MYCALLPMNAYWDKDLICRYSSISYMDWFGVNPTEMIDKMNIKDLFGPALWEQNKIYVEGVLKGEKQIFERKLLTPSGDVRHTHATYFPHIINDEVVGFYVTVIDISSLYKKDI